MFCKNCGTALNNSQFCGNCGANSNSQGFNSIRRERGGNNAFSSSAIIFGAVAFLFFPIIFGPIGLILGSVAKTKNEKYSTVALVVSGCGLVIGMILGAIVNSNLFS